VSLHYAAIVIKAIVIVGILTAETAGIVSMIKFARIIFKEEKEI